MKGHKMFIASICSIFILFFILIFFAYFYPIQSNYNKIAKLPSHDLTLFRDEYDRVRFSYPSGSYAVYEYDFEKDEVIRDGYSQFLFYDGEIINDRDDLFRMLNDDKLRSWNRKHYYFYDAENNLYMVFNNERDARISFTIKDYIHGYMLHMRNPPPFTSALGLGPLMFLSMEMFNVSGYTAWVSEARYGILANNPPNELVISPLRASLQIAFVFTLYLLPLLFCIAYLDINKATISIVAGFYFIVFIINSIYNFLNYSWLSW